MAPKFHAEHIGSLIRPASILKVDSEGLSGKQRSDHVDAAILNVLQTQIQLGITPLTNGEYPRANFFAAFFDKLEGFEARFVALFDGFRPEIPVIRGATASGMFKGMPCPIATGKIRWTRFAFEDEWTQIQNAIAHIAEGDGAKEKELLGSAKLTMPSPIMHHIRLKRGSAWTESSGYTDDAEFFADLTAAYQKELQALYDAGCRYVQIDDPDLTYFCDATFLSALRDDGVDPNQLLSMYLKAHNDAIKDRPEGLIMATHLCRGNMTDDLWLAKGSYENIARRLFTELSYDTFLLEYETEKAGSLEPLRYLPRGKTIVLGVVSTKQPELEDLEALERKVREAAGVIAGAQGRDAEEVLRDQIAVSPQCGFASVEHKKAVGSEERMWEKLSLVRDLAGRIWQE